MRIGIGLGLTGLRGVPADPFADLYGTGMGQMPMLLDPQDAVMSGADVVSIPNKGGAGPAFNATATGTGITRTGNLLNVTTGLVGLQLANAADLVGTRLFVVAAYPAGGGDTPRLFGRNSTNLGRVQVSTGQMLLVRDGVPTGLAGSPPGTALRLFEIEIAGGTARYWIDGVAYGTVSTALPEFLVTLLFTVGQTDGFVGLAGIIASVITGGSAALDPVMLRVRQTIAARHGIAVA